MRSEPILVVEGLRKGFRRFASRRQAVAALLGWGGAAAPEHVVLRDVSFSLLPGQALGVVGRNGSGKSTLLKLITGSLLPDAGSIVCRGRVSAILELGAGFDLQATGRQNMAMQGALWGVAPEVLAARAEQIVAFSELGSAIDEPVRTYSSGMLLRLAFAIAIHAEADVLIVDEALAVGDARFQQKCMGAIRAHLARGGALLFVSHDLNSVRTLCDEAILLERGEIVARGAPALVCDTYLGLLLEGGAAATAGGDGAVVANAKAQVTGLWVNGQACRDVTVRSGDWLEVRLALRAHEPVGNLAAGFMVHDVRGQDLFGVNTQLRGQVIAFSRAGQTCVVVLRVQVLLGAGRYTMTVAVHDADDYTRNVIFWGFSVIGLEVVDPLGDSVGHCKLPCALDVVLDQEDADESSV